MTKRKTMYGSVGWSATQRPQDEQQNLSGCCFPPYVEIAIKNELPPDWVWTGLTEHFKIKVQFNKNWWELPLVQAECVFAQLMNTQNAQAYYAWCWGKQRDGSWQPGGSAMRTNINRYMIDVEKCEQVNIDNRRTRKIKLECAEDIMQCSCH